METSHFTDSCTAMAAARYSGGTTATDALPEGFVMLSSILPDAVTDMRYAGSRNFVGTSIDGYEAPVPILTAQAAAALKKADAELQKKGFRIMIFDAYRPQRAVDHFIRWSQTPGGPDTQKEFYPGLKKSQLFAENYIAPRSSHSRGSAVDVSLFDIRRNCEADMGTPFDFFGERSHAEHSATLTGQQTANRRLLRQTMVSCGFNPLKTEWWHFSLAQEPFPDVFFDFPVRIYPER